MTAYDLSFDELDRSSPETKLLLIDLINSIKDEKDIDLSEERIFVEAFPKDDGGCLLYLSMLSPSTKYTVNSSCLYNTVVCTIDNPQSLWKICSELFRLYSHITHRSELYYDNDFYYLIIQSYRKSDNKMIHYLYEYCEDVSDDETVCSAIREYCICIFDDNAIEETSVKAI